MANVNNKRSFELYELLDELTQTGFEMANEGACKADLEEISKEIDALALELADTENSGAL